MTCSKTSKLSFSTLEKHDGHELRVFFEGVTEGRQSKIIAAGIECVTCRLPDATWEGAYTACVLTTVLK